MSDPRRGKNGSQDCPTTVSRKLSCNAFEGKTARTGWNQSLSYSNRRKVVGSKIGSEKKWKNMMMNGKR